MTESCTKTSIETLIEISWKAVLERQDKLGGYSIDRPALEPLASARLESRFSDDFTVLSQLSAALDLASRHALGELAGAIHAVSGQLRWSQNPVYDESSVSRGFLDGYAYAGLSGPDCPVLCEVPRCGYVLLGPDVTYTDHQHEAREIYLVLTPGSQWCLNSGDWFDVQPGDLILHASWQMHAMRTASQPLLAFAAWLESGDRTQIRI